MCAFLWPVREGCAEEEKYHNGFICKNNLDLLEQSVSIRCIQTSFFQMTGDDNDTMYIT